MTTQQMKTAMVNAYKPLVQSFLGAIAQIDCNGLPEPFFPVFGSRYASAEKRIVFAGIETRGYGDFSGFLQNAKTDIASCIFRGEDEFDGFAGGNNFGNDFCGFNLKFLASYYGLADWKALKRNENPEILKSVAWANANSIERYHVTAQGRGVKPGNWQRAKDASVPFDRLSLITQTMSPNIVILLAWGADDEIFPKVVDGRDSSSGEFGSILEDHSCNNLRQQRAAVELSPMILG